MFERLEKFWSDHGLEILVGVSLLIIVIVAFCRRGQQGTWSEYLIRPEQLQSSPSHSPQRVRTDSRGETECRRVLEQLYNRPFNKARPDFLSNPVTGGEYNLELDCYNDELKIAVEYNGVQHYKYTPYFHKSREAFQNQKYRDYMKRELCQKNGVTLIEVPYSVPIGEIEQYLRKRLA